MGSSGRQAAVARRQAQSLAGKGPDASARTNGHAATASASGSDAGATGRSLARARRASMSASGAAGIRQRDRRRGQPAPPSPEAPTSDSSGKPCDCGCRGAADHKAIVLAENARQESRPVLPASPAPGPRTMAPGRLTAMARRRAQSRSGKGESAPGGSTQARPPAQEFEEGPPPEHGDAGALNEPGNIITGTVAGSGTHITGAEPGTSGRVTGTEYLPRGDAEEAARRSSVGWKVGRSRTTRGGVVSGTPLGRSFLVTGNEPGTCKMVTGNEYVGEEQYTGLCSRPAPARRPATPASSTNRGGRITGSLPGRSVRVTGDEPGTCETVTGTPYSGADQIEVFCDEDSRSASEARARSGQGTTGADLTGQQPGLNGRLTGAGRGACEAVTGTPYVGKTDYDDICGSDAGMGGTEDSPDRGTPWTAFSVTSPAREARRRRVTSDDGFPGLITGPFGMGQGKVTGTEQFRQPVADPGATAGPATRRAANSAPVQRNSRITGEGIDAGLRITGDDWDRGDRVTGTEGSSSTVRNPTLRGGPVSAMPMPQPGREQPAAPESRVTGGSGASARGALVTVSGGARG